MTIAGAIKDAASSTAGAVQGAAESAAGAVAGAAGAALDCAKDPVACAKAAELALRVKGEKEALESLFIPESTVKWYQTERGALGFEPPTVGQLPMIFVIVPMLFSIILGIAYREGSEMVSITTAAATGKKTTEWQAIFFIFGSIVIFAIIVLILFYWTGPGVAVTNDLRGVQTSIGTKVGFQNSNSAPPSEASFKLVNVQPLSVKQVGFVGPSEKEGSFDPALGIQTAVRSGANFFTLQIDYLERGQDETKFDAVNVPTLLYRDSVGNLISSNGASINSVAKQLANYLFSPDLGASENPIILYLHFVRAPDPVKKPEAYLDFMKKVSQALEPIHTYILKDSGENFRRQMSESSLLQLTLPSIPNRIILLSNADTTIFRNSHATGAGVSIVSDLDSFINMRVYADKSADRIGITQTTDTKPNAVLVNYARLNAMSASEKSAFAMKGKNRFVIAMPGPLDNPSYSELKALLNETGVNAIPLNLIGTDPAPINKIISLWSSARPYYMLKPMMLQSYKTTVVPNYT
jgi:hypothetical protein